MQILVEICGRKVNFIQYVQKELGGWASSLTFVKEFFLLVSQPAYKPHLNFPRAATPTDYTTYRSFVFLLLAIESARDHSTFHYYL
jgi:hypothetical protein